MKNNKRSPLTLARQARFNQDMGIAPGMSLKDALLPDREALGALCGELIGKDTQAMVWDREHGAGYNTHRENNSDTYGRTLRQTRQKYAGDIRACHSPGKACDAETDERYASYLQSVSHVDMGEQSETTKD